MTMHQDLEAKLIIPSVKTIKGDLLNEIGTIAINGAIKEKEN